MINELKNLLAKEVMDTKTLKNLDFGYVLIKIEKYILTNGFIFKKLRLLAKKKGIENITKNKIFKDIIKNIRDELRIVYGSFLTDDFHKKEKVLEKIETKEDILQVLRFHKSTNERIQFYDEIYENIFNWYKPKNIADLGCGINSLSYFIIEDKLGYKPKYFASDLSSKDMDFLNFFFSKFNIDAKAKAYDLTDLNIIDDVNFNDCDMVFLFKTLDSIEHVKKNISKILLSQIKANYIVVSFPTKSLIAKKGFRMEKRNWFFNYLNKMGWKYEQFVVENELFILINKNA